MLRTVAVLALCAVVARSQDVIPSHAVFVPHPNAWRITKHPTLPVLYLACHSAPEMKNLVTFRLDDAGNVLTNTQREFPDYFTDDGSNSTNFHLVYNPVVLPTEKVLLLPAAPLYPAQYQVNSNAHHIAALALDDEGQPARKLASMRTTHTEATITVTRYVPENRRWYIGYGSYWGWCAVGSDGVPSPEFRMTSGPWNFWEFQYVPMWRRFYGVSAGTTLQVFRQAEDGQALEFIQSINNHTGLYGAFALSPSLRKIYLANGPDYTTINAYSLDKEGRLLGLPRRFTTGAVSMMRVDSVTKRLYTFTAPGTVRAHALDADGFPTGETKVWPIHCGEVRDVFVDETRGRLYIACTAAPRRAE